MTDPIVRRLTEERQALLALSTPHTEVQWDRLVEIRAQLDGIADADAAQRNADRVAAAAKWLMEDDSLYGVHPDAARRAAVGMLAAADLAIRKRALDQLVADAQAMGPYE